MFIGELSCLIAYFIKLGCKRRGGDREFGRECVNPLVFAPAAFCDMCGTSLMYIGLNLTYASSFQMLRGLFYLRLNVTIASSFQMLRGMFYLRLNLTIASSFQMLRGILDVHRSHSHICIQFPNVTRYA